MVTISDIAKKAGVAKSTVSRYLNGGSVSALTKEKIEKIVIDTGYTPNSFARSLKARKTNMLGVIIPRLNSASTNEILTGIDAASHKKGYQLIMTNADQKEDREIENLLALANQKVEGILFLAKNITQRHLDTIEKLPLPVLVLGQKVPGIHTMIHADEEAGRKMGEYALSLGHRRFLFVGVSEDDQAVGIDRKKGFLDALQHEKESCVRFIQTDFSFMDTYRKALEFLPEITETFVICATDNMALAVLKAAKELAFSIPRDFSLSGFGGYAGTSFVTPSITTIAYPFNQMGELAVDELEQLIQGKKMPFERVLSNELMVQKSTKRINRAKKECQ